MRARLLIKTLVVLWTAWPALAGPPACGRIVAVGDLHGGYDAFATILRETDLVDENLDWRPSKDCLVQLGDVVDRGARSREILDLLMKLDGQAAGRVHAILGNHEIMNVVGDLRYVIREEYLAFAEEETEEERRLGYETFLRIPRDFELDEEELREAFDENFPPGFFAHRRAFSPDGRYGTWLMTKPVMKKIGRTLFVHGSVTPEHAVLGIEAVNDTLKREVLDYVRLRGKLARADLLGALEPFAGSFQAVVERVSALSEIHPDRISPADRATAERFLDLRTAMFFRPSSPTWARDLAYEDENGFTLALEEILRRLGVDRVVAGHTPRPGHRIETRFDGRVFLIDTGAGPYYAGRVSALEIGPELIRAVYPGESETLATVVLSDEEIERFLLEGVVVDMEEIGSGITKPMKVTLGLDGRKRRAAFKTVDIESTQLTRFDIARSELLFKDSYVFDRAAYLLDRHLGLNLVPVVVLRPHLGKRGAFVDWVEDSVSEFEHRKTNQTLPNTDDLVRDRAVMRLFDALIYNTDRNLGNQLITLRDGRLHLIDHTRSFRLWKTLPEDYLRAPAGLPRALLAKLERLDKASLRELFDGLLSGAQIKALLSRRDKILEKIEADRKTRGDAAVFHD